MLYIKGSAKDYEFFRKYEEEYSDIVVSDSKNFDGSKELVEVFITLSPIVLSSITMILHDIISYMKSTHKDDSNNQSEIVIEKKTDDGEFRVILKSTDIDDIDTAVASTVKQIKKL